MEGTLQRTIGANSNLTLKAVERIAARLGLDPLDLLQPPPGR
jgi:hypothetical protein